MEERGSWKTLGNGQLFCRILQEYTTLLHSCILFNWVFPWMVPAIQGRLWATLSQSSVLPRHISTVLTDAVRDLVGGWQLAGKDGGCHGTQWNVLSVPSFIQLTCANARWLGLWVFLFGNMARVLFRSVLWDQMIREWMGSRAAALDCQLNSNLESNWVQAVHRCSRFLLGRKNFCYVGARQEAAYQGKYRDEAGMRVA